MAAQPKPAPFDVEKAQNVIFQPNPGPQTDFLSAPEQEVLFGGAAGGGKVVLEGQSVLTPSGFVESKDLYEGLVICDPKGGTQTITHVHPWQEQEKWEVELDDGTVYPTMGGHLWKYWLSRNGPSRAVVRSTEGMFIHSVKTGKTPILPTLDEAYFNTRQTECDPYVLGVFLGDGCLTTKSISFTSHEDDQEHYLTEMKLDRDDVRVNDQTIRVIGKTRKFFVDFFETKNLLGKKSEGKFVPENFLWSSKEDRLGVLQGLMDTDGYRDPGRARAEFTSVSKRLASDVKFIAQSLGFRVSIYTKIGSYKNESGEKVECQKVYRLYITGRDVDSIFRLSRKKTGVVGKQLGRRVVDIRKTTEVVRGRCITVSSEHSLYVSDDFVVTHNSYAMLSDPLRGMNNPAFRGIIFRRTNDELRELKSVSKNLWPKAIPGIKWSERDSQWTSPAGATFWMTYLDKDDDVTRYQGQAFSWIGFDELTQWPTPYAWDYMRSRLRTADPDLKLYMRACVDKGNVLTTKGWKDISSVQKGEEVYSLDSKGELVTRKVTGFYEYEVDEALVRVRKKNLSLSMTPDHRVVYRKQGSKKFDIVRFNEHTGKCIDVARTSLDYKAPGYTPNLLDFTPESYSEFLGLYVAEGCVNSKPCKSQYKVVITQNKEENHKFVRRVMESSGCKVCYCKNGDFQITSKELREHLLPLGKAHEKHFPRKFLDNASKEQLKLAFDAYALGDGHWQSPKSCTLVTVSKQLSEDLLEIAVKLGYKVQYKKYELENPNHRDKYVVYVSLSGCTTKVDKGDKRNDVSLEDYSGKVYCLGVEETENFILEQDGFVWVSGNTTNPGGAGHGWVKKTFIDPAPWGEAFWATDMETGKTLVWPDGHSKAGEPLFKRRFIPSKLKDNPYLHSDGIYEANLLSLPERQRKQLLEGDWDTPEGAAFTEWNREIHTCDPFLIPLNWPKFRACDYGYGSKTAVLWFAVAPDGQLIVYRELYTSKVTAVDLAGMILEQEYGEKIRYGMLDSSLWHNRGDIGPSLAEQMIAAGCHWRPSDRSKGTRISGKNELHRRLQVDQYNNKPGIVFFNTCKNITQELPMIPLDKNNPEDVDTKSKIDHGYDALRYGIMSRPKVEYVDDLFSNTTIPETPSDQTFGY